MTTKVVILRAVRSFAPSLALVEKRHDGVFQLAASCSRLGLPFAGPLTGRYRESMPIQLEYLGFDQPALLSAADYLLDLGKPGPQHRADAPAAGNAGRVDAVAVDVEAGGGGGGHVEGELESLRGCAVVAAVGGADDDQPK